MPLRRRQKLVDGEPSVLSRARREGDVDQNSGADKAVDAPAGAAAPERTEAHGTGSGFSGEETEQMTAEPPNEGSTEVEEMSADEGLVGKAQPIDPGSGQPVRAQLDRLAEQIRGLQQQLDEFIAHRSETASEQVSQQVAAIVAAAEESAADIRASAERDAVSVRDRLLADVQAEVERIRSEAQADAGRIRTEAHAEAARVREQAITEASAEIQAVCARLAEELQAAARSAIAGIATGPRVTFSTAREPQAPLEDPAPAGDPAPEPEKAITDEVEDAVDELQTAAAVLEQSLRHLRTLGGDEPAP